MQSAIVVILVVIVGFYILRRITRLIFRAIIFLALIGLSFIILYLLGMPPFENEMVNVGLLKEKYCESDSMDKTNAMCDCVIPYLQAEKDTTTNDNSRWDDLVATRKVLTSHKGDILDCYAKKGFEKVSWETILKTIFLDSKPNKD